MNVALAILIAFVQVVSPWLCCCRIASLVPPVAGEAAQSAPAHEPVCPHCKHETPPGPDAPSLPACPHDSEPGGCCSKVLVVATVPQPDPVAWEQLLVGEPPVGLTETANPLLPPRLIATLWQVGTSDLPFLTTAARLHAHHALRC